MSYRVELSDKVASSVTSVALEQLDRVARELVGKSGDTAIHEGRKSIKRTRALLQLARVGIGETTFKAHNAALRDIAQSFSGDRDRHVLRETAAKCAAAMPAHFKNAFAAIDASLSESGNDATAQAAARDKAKADLTAVRQALQSLKFAPDSFDTLRAGLERSYRRGRQQLRRAYAEPTDEGFHDLRKAVQQHWRHMQVLQRGWPELFTARLAAARRLSQILGDDHDLAVFNAYVASLSGSKIPQATRRAIARHCQTEQRSLRRLAHPLCQQLYAERAGSFGKRIAAIWLAAVRLAEVEAAQAKAAGRAGTEDAPRKPKPIKSSAGKPAGKSKAKPAKPKARAARGNSAQQAKPA